MKDEFSVSTGVGCAHRLPSFFLLEHVAPLLQEMCASTGVQKGSSKMLKEVGLTY